MVLCFLKEDDFSIESGRVQNSEEIISGFGAATSRRAEYYSEAILLPSTNSLSIYLNC